MEQLIDRGLEDGMVDRQRIRGLKDWRIKGLEDER